MLLKMDSLGYISVTECIVHIGYMSSRVCLSVTFVHLTQAIEIFGNVSTTFNTLAM